MKIINPATEEIITDITADTPESLAAKFKLLRDGATGWKDTLLSERAGIINCFSSLLDEEMESLSLILTSEVGKPLQQSRNEINGARTRIKWLTSHVEKYLSDEVMYKDELLEEKIAYEPLGVICNISAWNYPYLVGVNVFIPALLAGNAVMYKPSEYATLTGQAIEGLLRKAGVPETVFQLAIGAADTGEHLLDLPFNGYFFTGSNKTGQRIYERVSKRMVPCQCELGGKDPLYVADDVENIISVAAATADGAFYNNGQSCCAVERIYVNEKIYGTYLEAFVDEVKTYKAGDPLTPGVYIGPLTRKEQLTVIEEQVKDAIAKGATLLTGGKRMSGKGYYYEPTVLADVTHDMLVMRDESFGPVIGIMKVHNDDEAVARMNDTDYGLTASVYSASRERAEAILRRIDSGTGYWNCCDRVSPAIPWSGRKHSGFGSTLSHAGIRAFVKPRAYHLRTV
jgi:acyl-CoA reductase-like NAD-dependent aldehyde dehydrogenase